MHGVLSASRLMTAGEVRQECAKAKNNPFLLMAIELEAKRQLFEFNRRMQAKEKSSKCGNTHCS